MTREVKRVQMDFDYPLKKVWYGYQLTFCHEDYKEGCARCREFARVMGIPMDESDYYDGEPPCPDFKRFYKVDPPTGDGFQLWGNTTEGGPRSPVFGTAEELAEWCAENDTVFADIKATKAEWLKMIESNYFVAASGGALFV